MSLSNFFKINLPYGIKRNPNDEWFAFNREYAPIGWNTLTDESIFKDDVFSENPIYTKYQGLTEAKLLDIVGDEKFIRRDANGKIELIYFYDDYTVPTVNVKFRDLYFEKVMKIGVLNR